MAATEVIHFPVCVQLNRGATIQVDAFRDSSVSPPGSPPHLELSPYPLSQAIPIPPLMDGSAYETPSFSATN